MSEVRRWATNKTLAWEAAGAFARFFMAFIWIKAGIAKLDDHMAVTQSIKGYELLPAQAADYLAYIMGPLEIAAGVMLLLGLFLRPVSAVCAVVLVVFMVGIGQAWARGLSIDCGCFSVEVKPGGHAMNYFLTLLRDAFFLVLTAWTVKWPWKKLALYP